jgi:asparagine synthase (glutamine-hydrolysing)
MCGILGQINKNTLIQREVFGIMLDQLEMRGPDGFGIEILNNGKVFLGHRRLSIIDLSDNAKQPLCNENGTIWLIFNGEIYNYKALRQELQKLGHHFKTDSDSEVIIHGFETWGKQVVHKLRGIFAFGIYNALNQELFLARDHAGVKPLYFLHTKDTLIFASEPKAILKSDLYKKEIDTESFQLYLKYGNVPSDYSIYKGIKKLKPGHSLSYNLSGKLDIEKYWYLTYNPTIFNIKDAEVLLYNKIKEAIDIQTASDVSIGSLLSGGVDSTIVTGILNKSLDYKLNTFSIGFDDTISDESAFASLVAKHYDTQHHTQQMNVNLAFEGINQLANIFDEPFHFNGLIPYLFLSQNVAKHNFKVVMGGDGADELFAGYKWYDQFNDWHKNQPKQIWIQRFLGDVNKNSQRRNAMNQYSNYNGHLSESQIKHIVNDYNDELSDSIINAHYCSELHPVLAAQLVDFNCFMPDHCLMKVDKTSMSQGVEVRVPFLDIELIKMVFEIDNRLIYNKGERKSLLKLSMKEFIPSEMDSRRKKGFSSPLSKWLNEGISEKGIKLLKNGYLFSDNLLDADSTIKAYNQLSSGNQLLLIGLEMWGRKWMLDEEVKL